MKLAEYCCGGVFSGVARADGRVFAKGRRCSCFVFSGERHERAQGVKNWRDAHSCRYVRCEASHSPPVTEFCEACKGRTFSHFLSMLNNNNPKVEYILASHWLCKYAWVLLFHLVMHYSRFVVPSPMSSYISLGLVFLCCLKFPSEQNMKCRDAHDTWDVENGQRISTYYDGMQLTIFQRLASTKHANDAPRLTV